MTCTIKTVVIGCHHHDCINVVHNVLRTAKMNLSQPQLYPKLSHTALLCGQRPKKQFLSHVYRAQRSSQLSSNVYNLPFGSLVWPYDLSWWKDLAIPMLDTSSHFGTTLLIGCHNGSHDTRTWSLLCRHKPANPLSYSRPQSRSPKGDYLLHLSNIYQQHRT